jgi:hypothetical protein
MSDFRVAMGGGRFAHHDPDSSIRQATPAGTVSDSREEEGSQAG